MSNFIRIAKANISEYLKDEEVNILANQKVLALIQQKKRLSYNHSGTQMEWQVKKARNSITPYTDAAAMAFQRLNRHERAALEWRAYVVPEQVTWMEKLQNKGKEALTKYATNLGESIKDDLKFNFEDELFKDGNAAANAGRLHGFASCLGVTSNAQYTAPSDTYAGLSTVLGNYGGAVQSGAWPSGKFDAEYYFWSPLVVNYSHGDWAGGTSWSDNAIEAMRNGILFQRNAKGKDGQLDLIVKTASMYSEFLNSLGEKERIQVKRDGEKSGLVSLGFTDVVNFDGVDVTSCYSCPDTQAYGLNFNELELCSLQGQLFDIQDAHDIDTMSDKFVGTFAGNMKMNPRHIVLWDNIT